MRSKRAIELICMHENAENAENADAYYGYEMLVARSAVELAEDDVRERAVRAYCMTSQCLMIAAMRPPCEGDYCNRAMEFLKTYDNEN